MKGVFILSLFVLSTFSVYGAEVVELATFPKSSDQVINACYESVLAAKKKGEALCKEKGFGEYWVCPPSKDMRLQPIIQCKTDAQKSKDKATMLYLLGLIHQDFRFQPGRRECPDFYRHQVGSDVCVYTNYHFDQLMREFPKSSYSDMAAFKKAESAYRYYECEGSEICSVENTICGWVEFLKDRPSSPLAGTATRKITDALNGMSNTNLNPRESFGALLNDLKTLRAVAPTLPSDSSSDLTHSLDTAEAVIANLQSAK